jgi:RNase H-fold protein (predicted Holliday junction resolvase)
LLGEAGLTRKRRKERLDMLAAQMILTAWLEAQAAGNHDVRPQGLDA